MFASQRFLAISTLLIGTSVSVTLAGTAEEGYSAAATKWKAAGLRNYEYSVSNAGTINFGTITGDNCGNVLPVRLTVRHGKAVSGVYLDTTTLKPTQKRIPSGCLRFFHSVTGLMTDIQSLIAAHRELQVSYDARYGYPTVVELRYQLDGDYPVKVWDLSPLKP